MILKGVVCVLVKAMERYLKNPVAFVREILRVEPDEWQAEILKALTECDRAAVRSGHGV